MLADVSWPYYGVSAKEATLLRDVCDNLGSRRCCCDVVPLLFSAAAVVLRSLPGLFTKTKVVVVGDAFDLKINCHLKQMFRMSRSHATAPQAFPLFVLLLCLPAKCMSSPAMFSFITSSKTALRSNVKRHLAYH